MGLGRRSLLALSFRALAMLFAFTCGYLSRGHEIGAYTSKAAHCISDCDLTPSQTRTKEFTRFLELSKHETPEVVGSKVAGLSGLDFLVWETDPKPIYLSENGHLGWYNDQANERKLLRILRSVLSQATPARGIVLDMGMNDGFVAALAASFGFTVVAVDGQPECVRRFSLAVAVNGWESIEVHNRIVMNKMVRMNVSRGICGGGSSYHNGVVNGSAPLDPRLGAHSDLRGLVEVESITVDELVRGRNVIFFHLDVEGAEQDVLASATKLLGDRRMHNIFFEFAPMRWENKRAQSKQFFRDTFRNYDCIEATLISEGEEGGLRISEHPKRISAWDVTYDDMESKKYVTDIFCTIHGSEHLL